MVEAHNHLASSSSFQNKVVRLEREEMFGTCKQKLGTPSFIGNSHHSDGNNFFVLHCHASLGLSILHNILCFHHLFNSNLLQTWHPLLREFHLDHKKLWK
jgi:hypothetical protein